MSADPIQNWKALVPAGTDAFFVSECGSTNTLAVDAGQHGVKGPGWYIAGRQTAGRGRRGRQWTSEEGNLFCSYLFTPPDDIDAITALPFIVSLAVRDMLIAFGCHHEDVKCKWPNDVLVDERKICGILIESSASSGKRPDFVVIGIGVNLNQRPQQSQFPAVSLREKTGDTHIAPDKAFGTLAQNLDHRIKTWPKTAMAILIEEWSACAWGFGRRREIRTHQETFHATVMGLEADGGLKLRMDDGTSRRLYAGDVFGI